MQTIDDFPDPDEIRKADSKGRISGFRPDAHYYAVRGDGVVRLTRVVRELDTQLPAHEAGLLYLEVRGIDHHAVAGDDHDASGFWKIKLDENGNKVFGRGVMLREWCFWPDGFDYDEFVRLCNLTKP